MNNKHLTLNKIISSVKSLKASYIKSNKHFPSSTREWKNSIYLYHKNSLNLIPYTNISSIKLLKSYFSLFNKKIEKIIRTKKIIKKNRALSTNKIYFSRGEFKHTNNKILINLYLFNRQKKTYNLTMKFLKRNMIRYIIRNNNYFLNRQNNIIKYAFFSLKKKKLFLQKKLCSFNDKRINKDLTLNIKHYIYNLIKNEQNKILFYWYYKQLNYINKAKYTDTYIQYLKEFLYAIYNKQVELNLVNLKRFYFNSDIISEISARRISEKRKKTSGYLKRLKDKIIVLRKGARLHKRIIKNKILYKKKDISKNTNILTKTIIKNLKYKDITGFRMEAKGRLTKRIKAARSVLNISYKGNLLNMDSSLRGLSSVLLKGNLKSNVQYSKYVSKTKIGSFGIKGWISSN